MSQTSRQWLFMLIPAVAGASASITEVGRWASASLLIPLGVPAFLHIPLVLTFFGVLTAVSYYVFRPRSRLARPERFDLRASTRSELFGRDKFLQDIGGKAKNSSILFLMGESGSGKSAVLSPGLVNDLSKDVTVAPILLELSSSNWDNDQLYKLFNAINDSPRLNADPEKAVPPPSLVGSDTSLNERLIVSHIRKIHEVHRVRLVLLIDQVDDYVIYFKDRFVDEDGNWINSHDLEVQNRFWASIAALAREGIVRLVIALRTDAGSVIPSLSFEGLTKSVSTVSKLRSADARLLLEQAAKSDSAGETVTSPLAGWHDLREAVLEDIAKDDRIPIQDVRMALLGMRELNSLTPSEYARVNGLRGLMALHVRNSIRRVASGFNEDPQDAIREILMALVSYSEDGAGPRGAIASEDDLIRLISDPTESSLLGDLERAELIRRAQSTDKTKVFWNLYHDSLAQAVVDERVGYSNWDTFLRDKFRGYRHSSRRFSVIRVLPNLLGPLEWSVILKERALGRLRLHEARSYFLISSITPAAAVAVLLGAWMLYGRVTEYQEAQVAVASILEERVAFDRAQMSAWGRGGSYRSSLAEAIWDRFKQGQVVSDDQWELLVSLYSYDKELRAELLQRIDEIAGTQFDPLIGEEGLAITHLKAMGLAGERERLKGVISDLKNLAVEECKKDMSAFSGYDTRVPKLLTEAAIASDDETIKREVFNVIEPCVSSTFGGQNFFLQSLNQSMNSLSWRKDHFSWAVNSMDFSNRGPLRNLPSVSVPELQDDINEISDKEWAMQALVTLQRFTQQNPQVLKGRYANQFNEMMISTMKRTGQFGPVLPQLRINYLNYAKSEASKICSDELVYSGFRVNLLQIISALDKYPFVEEDMQFLSELCNIENRPDWIEHQENQIIRYLYARSNKSDQTSQSLRAAVDDLIESRSKPEGRSVVQKTANSASTTYIIGTDKLAFEISENAKFVGDAAVLDELARSLMLDLKSGPIVPNYSSYAAIALAEICAAGCSVDLISEVDPFIMDLMARGVADSRLDSDEIADAWSKMIAGQSPDALTSTALPRLHELSLDPSMAGLRIRAILRAYALSFEELVRLDKSVASESRPIKYSLTILSHPLIDWEDRRRIFVSVEQLSGEDFEGSLTALLAWAEKERGLGLDQLNPAG